MKTKPIIPYIGGKRRLASHLLPKFPEHECYVELFCGGAALFFMREQPAKVEIINDVNGELVNLYRVVQHHLEEFVRQFKWSLVSRQMFKWLQDIQLNSLTDIQRAARFYYLQQIAFGAKLQNQSFGCGTTQRPVNFLRIEEQLSAAHLRLSTTYIENLSWQDCFKRYDKPHTFFYADPPYWKVEGYGIAFRIEQYEQLAEAMLNAQGKVLLSVNDHPDMRAVFSGLSIDTTQIKYALNDTGKPKQSTELIICNY